MDIKSIETKIANGDYSFSAGEVVYLLNTIRVQKEQLNIAMQRLGIPLKTMKERNK